MGKNKKKVRSISIPLVNEKRLKNFSTRNDKFFKWSFNKCSWSSGGWDCFGELKDFVDNIISKLQDYETMTWQEIESASGGKSVGHGNNNHFIDIINIPNRYLSMLSFRVIGGEYDKVFSLRLTAKERLFGIVEGAIFYVIWYDKDHSTLPVKK